MAIGWQERRIIDNFIGTLSGLTLEEAMTNAELDAKSYRLSRAAARELGHRIRMYYSKIGGARP